MISPYILVAVDEDDAEGRGLQTSTSADNLYIIPLTDVVDMDRYGGVRANAVFLHQRYELTFRQIVWGRCLFLY